jgi:hypothetical protein
MLNNSGSVCLFEQAAILDAILKNAQGCQGGITQILNLDILSFHLIPRIKLWKTFEGFSAGLDKMERWLRRLPNKP